MTSSVQGKERLLANVFYNVSYVVLSALIIVLLTPYLVGKLGIELYGLIALVVSIVSYINIFTMSIASSVSRFVTLSYHKNDFESGQIYFNTAFIALVFLGLLLMIPIVVISNNFSTFFDVPKLLENDASLLFLYVMIGSLITSIASPFMVGVFVKHRFDYDSIIKIVGKIFQVITLILLFEYISPKINYFGLSYIVMSSVMLIMLVYMHARLLPELMLNFKLFQMASLVEMSSLGGWNIVNQVGALLYLAIAIMLANLWLGAEAAGKYAAVSQWVTLLGVLGGAVTSVFTPIVYEYVAKNDIKNLTKQISRSIKYVSLLVGLPVGLICGFATSVLSVWLGSEYSDLSVIMVILIAPWLISIGVRPLFAVFSGMLKVKIPALVTLLIGIVNILIIYVLINVYDMGIIAIAISLLICLGGKNLIFTPIYAAIITDQKYYKYIKDLLPGSVMALSIAVLGFIIDQEYNVDTVLQLIVLFVILSVIYLIVSYLLFATKDDKKMFLNILRKKVKGSN